MKDIGRYQAVELRFIGELPRAETSQIIVSHISCTRVCIDFIGLIAKDCENYLLDFEIY